MGRFTHLRLGRVDNVGVPLGLGKRGAELLPL